MEKKKEPDFSHYLVPLKKYPVRDPEFPSIGDMILPLQRRLDYISPRSSIYSIMAAIPENKNKVRSDEES